MRVLQRLRVFHAQCLRAMCCVTRKHTWEHHITSIELMQRLGLDGIDFYVARRQLIGLSAQGQHGQLAKPHTVPVPDWDCGSV